MSLCLHDTATGAVRPFRPLRPGKAGVYVCGLTVQSAPHVGHIRFGLVFDVLVRWLRRTGLDVTYIRNVTDIDDKILLKSAEEGVEWYAHAYAQERELARVWDLLGCLPPTYEPRATGHVPEMIGIIQTLIDRGHAYAATDGSGDVYFDIHSWPAYGELSHQRPADMAPAEDADPRGKKDPRDFALWKGHKPTEPASASWPTPWGAGRPGWHLECSAMAGKYLGTAFDIHGGGIDLRFPHHENEMAQSRAAGQEFAQTWMHNAWVTTSGEKMSKSLGNSLLVTSVVERVRPVELRYYLVAPHYRSTIEFSFEALEEAAAGYRRIERLLVRGEELLGAVAPAETLPAGFSEALDDDLAVPRGLGVLFETVRAANAAIDAGAAAGTDEAAALGAALADIRAMLGVLGLDPGAQPWVSQAGVSQGGASDRSVTGALVRIVLDQRSAARARKDFAAADAIRNQLAAAGIAVEDTPTGARWTSGISGGLT